MNGLKIGSTILMIFVAARVWGDSLNLIANPDFVQNSWHYQISGNADYQYLGDPNRDISGWGVAFNSTASWGSVSQMITGLDAKAGRWYRFTIRGLPQDGFEVDQDDLAMDVEFFGDGAKTAYDQKAQLIYPLIEQARKDMTVNGDNHVGGAAVWRTYQLDVYLPFPQVDSVRLSARFGHGAARSTLDPDFFVTRFSFVKLDDAPEGEPKAPTNHAAIQRHPDVAKLIPIGGRWFYEPTVDQPTPPALFDQSNSDRLLYHDSQWTAPFAGNMTAVLHAGNKDVQGRIVDHDQLITDNVTVGFDATSMIIHTKGLPNHPTAKFPQEGWGPDSNPNFIQEKLRTYFIPLNPQENPRHIVTTIDNSNHALPMGPIGIAVNGVVFFNPFDANSMDASSLMDRCCGHPAPDGTYHYHKYPICLNSPWADEGQEHSPLIGWAFDGFPIYGPYEEADVMAKDETGDKALNDFNGRYDAARGWHYQVTPGKFPYIIGGYWGTEDPRDVQRRRGGMGPGGPGGGPGGFGGGGPGGPGGSGGFGPPPPP
jgi:hypothetical protein